MFSILRFFEDVSDDHIDTGKTEGFTSLNLITRQLIQIGTGEGKSVVLAATAVILALLGYNVSCACYSNYLSQRDFDDFSELFSLFQVSKYIRYGEFANFAEFWINSEVPSSDLRKTVKSLFYPNSEERPSMFQKLGNYVSSVLNPAKREIRPSCLLVDEIDVFFSVISSEMRRPLLLVEEVSISNLLMFMFTNREKSEVLKFEYLVLSDVFIACKQSFPEWIDLLECSLKEMIVSLENLKSHKYKVIDGKIAYLDPLSRDSMTSSYFYSCYTAFAYLKENACGDKMDQCEMERFLGLKVSCGKFSFAEILNSFSMVIGVTATVDTMTETQKAILSHEFNIQKFTYIPRTYGPSRLVFSKTSPFSVIVSNDESFSRDIVNEIKQRMVGENSTRRYRENNTYLFWTS